MLLICVSNNTHESHNVPNTVYHYTNTHDITNKKCLIYSSKEEVRLYIFTHIKYDKDLVMDIDTIPLPKCTSINFYYERRFPVCTWDDFFFPYKCDPSLVYDISLICDALSNQHQPIDTMITIYAPSGLSSNEIISRVKYITKERLDIRSYKLINSMYPNVQPVPSTISEVRELSNGDKSIIISMIKETSIDTAALLLFEYLNHRVICSSVESKTIYIFTDMWHKDDGHAYLNRLMMYEMREYLCNTVSNTNKIINIGGLLTYFSNYREDIINRLCILAESKSFTSMLDDKINTIATPDGTYDFNNDIFRDTKASDYVSICTRAQYICNDTNEKINHLILLLSTFFPNPEILDFFLSTVALSLGGRNFEKIVVVWVGKTDSGKSTCQEFIEHVLGEYCGSLPSSMLVGKRTNPHGTTSALSSIGKKRLLFIQEPEEVKINSSQLKSLSGNDSIYSREIYEKGSTTRIKAITTIVTNGRMDFSGCDQAALSRIIVIPFTSTFVTSREKHRYKSTSNIRDADNNILSKLKQLSSPMIHILINKYRNYLTHGYKIPDTIREHIEEFISNCSPALYFMNSCLVHSKDASIQINILFTYFSSWYKDAYPGNKLMPLYQFKETIKSSGYDITKEFLVGYAFNS